MANYRLNVVVHYDYEVEADSLEEAQAQGWDYENFAHLASVYSVDVYEVDEDEEEE